METFNEWELDGYYRDYGPEKWLKRFERVREQGLQARFGAIHKTCLKVIPSDGFINEANCHCGELVTKEEIVYAHGLEVYIHRFMQTVSSREQREAIMRSRI